MRSYFSIPAILIWYYYWKLCSSYLKIRKYKTRPIMIFKHRSSIQIFNLIFFIFGLIASIYMMFFNRDYFIKEFIFLLAFITINLYHSLKEIQLFERGILLSGEFIEWNELKSIKVKPDNTVAFEFKNSFGIKVFNKVVDVNSLLNLCQEHMINSSAV